MTAGVPLAALILYFSPIRRVRDLPASPREDSPGESPVSAGIGTTSV